MNVYHIALRHEWKNNSASLKSAAHRAVIAAAMARGESVMKTSTCRAT